MRLCIQSKPVQFILSKNLMGKAKICMSGVQDIVEGVTPPRCEYMNGFAACPDVKDTFCARVHDIFPPQVS